MITRISIAFFLSLIVFTIRCSDVSRDTAPALPETSTGLRDAASGKSYMPPNPDPTWWHAELILVCVRLGQPDVLMQSEQYYYFKHSNGSVESGHSEGTDSGSRQARDVLALDFPGYDFE